MTSLRNQYDSFMRYRHLLGNLVRRDLTVKYRRSALGWLWSMLNPLLMMLVMTAVFSYMFKMEIDYFPVYLLCGQLVFNFFSEATNTALDSVIANSALIKKVYIPKYIFPLEKIIFSFVNTLFSFVPLIGVIIVLRAPLTFWAMLAPVPLLMLFVFNLGAGMILSSLVIFFRDIKHLYGVLVLALTYMTPIFYPESLLPEGMKTVIQINPLYWFVSLFRQLVWVGKAPTAQMWLLPAAWAVVLLVLGVIIFKRNQDRFILYI